MQRLDTAPIFSVKWSLYGFLAFMWFLTVQGTMDGNKRVVPIYILLPASLLSFWWLSGFKRVSLSGNSLIVHERDGDKRIPLDSVKCVSKLAFGEGFAHVTIVFKDHAHRRIRVKAFRKDCEHVASLIRSAMRETSSLTGRGTE
jgi:hypothetical protein